jgi:hypothetical protein
MVGAARALVRRKIFGAAYHRDLRDEARRVVRADAVARAEEVDRSDRMVGGSEDCSYLIFN